MTVQDASASRAFRPGPWLLLLAAVAVCLAVLAINRGPLYYFDTGSYFRQGDTALSLVLPRTGKEAPGAAAKPDSAKPAKDDDEMAGGSRSMVYALLVAAFWRAGALGGLALVNLAAVLLSVWLVARAACRALPLRHGSVELTAIPLLAAGATSLPFYIAYAMPDIFAPVMIVLIAGVAALGRHMPWPDRIAALALAAFAVIVHPSHLGIAALMLPILLLAAVLREGRGRWIGAAFAACLVLVAVGERKAFEFATETVTHKDVVYTPFITARLIVDGPGLAYLDEHCPDDTLATCALHEALSWSDDPYRLTATHIVFERSPRLGSFLLMSAADQKAVAAEQRAFFFRVLADRPFGTVYALMENAAVQLMMNSIKMTVPNAAVVKNAKTLSGLPDAKLGVLDSVLRRDQPWLGVAETAHTAIYLLSLAVVVALLLWPGRVAPRIKLFVLFVLIGIAVNALVCGGVSQPADRYGARVMWLLPFSAAFLLLCLPGRRPAPATGART